MKDEYTLSLLLISFYRFAGYKQFLWWIYNGLGKGFRKQFLHVLYGVFVKNVLQPMEVISLSRKAVMTRQNNYMEITDAL